jgi:hypothetical protein
MGEKIIKLLLKYLIISYKCFNSILSNHFYF